MAIQPIKPPVTSEAPRQQQIAMKWLVGRITQLQVKQTIPGAINPGNYTNRNLFDIGEVFLYHYDPKWKAKLPYYDTFPLVIPIEFYDNGFLGLNLHYLPMNMRMSFLNRLIRLAAVAPGTERVRMQISYSILKDSKRLINYIPCVKRYLVDHIRGRMLKIQSHEWVIAYNLPIADFQKAGEATVWRDSRRIIAARR